MRTASPSPIAEKTERFIGPKGNFLVALMIGAISGFGAVAFRGLIAVIHNLLLLGTWSIHYDANLHTPKSPWGIGVFAVPILASLGVTFLVRNFAPEARGHGVPEVMDAVYYKQGRIRSVVVWIKCLASALSIGSGGSVGREGPIVQIGSAFGSWLGAKLRVPAWERITWLACGAAGGIAATFNTPIGGILFATELILQEVSAKTLIPVALSSAIASYVGRRFFGVSPSFVIPSLETSGRSLTALSALPAYALMGVLMGIVSTLFIRALYKTDDLFSSRFRNRPYLGHACGMAMIGALMVGFEWASGHYYVEGVGYATVQDVLSGKMLGTQLLVALAVGKLLATSITLGSGASGGIFSPSLFLGATLGNAFGRAVEAVYPHFGVDPTAFAVVGMASVVAGATGAAVTAIVMIFEMTSDYRVIVPMTVAVALSYGFRVLLSRESIYTEKLFRRGHSVPTAFHADLLFMKNTEKVMDRRFLVLKPSRDITEFMGELKRHPDVKYFVIEEKGEIRGVVSSCILGDLSRALSAKAGQEMNPSSLANPNFIFSTRKFSLSQMITQLRRSKADFILVANRLPLDSTRDIVGVLSREQLADLLINESEIFSSDSER